jgi:hypothetical protein
MKTLWSKLCPSRTRTIHKATRQARKPRLSIEKLDDRVLPSATGVLSNGILTITADDSGSNVNFFNLFGNQWLVVYDSGTNSQSFTGPINEIVFKGGRGNDTFWNESNIKDLVIGSPGNDTYNGGSGINLLDRNGNRVSWSSTSGQNVTFGLGDGSVTTNDLNATGSMMVSVSSVNKSQLTVAGPSGIGFRLDASSWEDSVVTDSNGVTTHTFKPHSTSVTLHTSGFLGDIQLTGAGQAGLTISTKGTKWTDSVGEFNTMTIGPNFPLDTSATSKSKFLTFGEDFGADLKLPSLDWGLQLGNTLAAKDGVMSGAPLNTAVPYFFVSNSAMASATVGGYAAQLGTSISAAFDPSDPFVYASAKGIPTPEGPIDIAVGVSVNGRILFTPPKELPAPSSVLGAPVPPPNISGNVYLGGIIPLPETPLAITGNIVVGLVHDVNGNLAAGSKLTRTHADGLLHRTENASTLIQSMNSQPTIGINGELDIGKDFLAGSGIVQMKLGNAVAYYVPNMTNPNPNGVNPADVANYNNGLIAKLTGTTYFDINPDKSIIPSFTGGHAFVIYAQSANPWDGIPIPGNLGHTFGQVIDAIQGARQFSLQGIVDSQKDWGVRIEAGATSFFGFGSTSKAVFEASSLTKEVAITANIESIFGLASLTLHGTLDLQTGDISVFEKAGVSFSVPNIVTLSGSEQLTFSFKAASLQASAALDFSASAGTFLGTANFFAHAGVTLDLNNPIASHVLVNGSAELDVNDHKWFDASIDNNGVTIAGHTFSWPKDGDLIADGPALVGNPAMLHFFVPPGITGALHFSAALSQDGLAANYDAASTDPKVMLTFNAPGTYTVFGRIYRSDGDVSDYQTTVTVYGSDQHDMYFVERLYHDLLGRASDSAGAIFYIGALAHGATHEQVQGWFTHSLEYQQDVVHAAYHEMLGRFAELEGLRGWVSFLQAGHTAEELRSHIATSPEYAQLHGDDAGFVQGLYQDVLGRTGSTAEVDYYTQVLAGTASRADVVQAFFGSPEHQTHFDGANLPEVPAPRCRLIRTLVYDANLEQGGKRPRCGEPSFGLRRVRSEGLTSWSWAAPLAPRTREVRGRPFNSSLSAMRVAVS